MIEAARPVSRKGKSLPDLWKAAFTGLALGFFLAFLLGSSVWLEMRASLGRLLPLSAGASLLLSLGRGVRFRFRTVLVLQLAGALTFLLLYGFDMSALRHIPASLVREGFGLTSLPLSATNALLGLALISGNAAWLSRRS